MREENFYCSNKTTVTLEWIVRHCGTFEEFEQECSEDMLNEDCRVGNYLAELLYKYNQKASVVSDAAKCSFSYVGNIINGKKNNPSRNVLICICLVIGATVEETQCLLKYAGHAPLYVRKKRDVIIWFGLMKGMGLEKVNEILLKRGLVSLYKIE